MTADEINKLAEEARNCADGYASAGYTRAQPVQVHHRAKVFAAINALRDAAMLAASPSAPAASSEDARDAALVAARGWIKGICAEYNIGRPFSLFDQIDAAIAATPEAPK